MKQLVPILLALVLSGCGALAPAAPTAGPTGTPQIVVQTVMVTVVVTQLVTGTPTSTPTPTLTPIPTFTVQPSELTATGGATQATGTLTVGTPATAAGTSPTATLPANAGGDIFTDLTRSSDHFGLGCQPDTLTFGVSTTNTSVSEVDLFYRVEDQLGSSISGWIDIGKMLSDGNGNFTMNFTASMVDPDLRGRKVWFDYQFVGLSKASAVLGRSAKIVKQITYTTDCSG